MIPAADPQLALAQEAELHDKREKRRLVLTAAIRTVSTAIRHLYEDDIEAAKEAGDILGAVRLKAQLKNDWEAWSGPMVAALEELDRPPLIVTMAEAWGNIGPR